MARIYLGILIVTILGLTYWKYTDMVSKIDQLKEEKIVLTIQLSEQENTIDTMEKKKELQDKTTKNLQESISTISKEKDAYLSILRRHDLTKLAAAKPGMIEKRVNNGIRILFKELENETNPANY